MDSGAQALFAAQLDDIRSQGLWKEERTITSPQGAWITVASPAGAGGSGSDEFPPSGAPRADRRVLNFCSNNYLGLSSHPDVVAAAKRTLDQRGFGMSSVRFICGTQDLHRQLEDALAGFFGFEDAVLYGSCFDANGGLFETLLTEEDAVISDALNHASIIDGIRLCKAQRFRYTNGDLDDLARRLDETRGARIRLIATDGVFSMDGTLAPLDGICTLADEHGALVMVDDSHASGFIGPTGRGTPEHFGVQDRVDIVTSTLGKALGGASGGFVAGSRDVCDLLRQRSRPYLFSNALAPTIAGAGLTALGLLEGSSYLRDRLMTNASHFRAGMSAAGFTIPEGVHPIVPVMVGPARLASDMAADLLDEGIYVVGFSYPVVPRDTARIRVQLSAVHEPGDVEAAIAAFVAVGRRRGLLPT